MNIYISLLQFHLFQWHQHKSADHRKLLRTFLLPLSYVKMLHDKHTTWTGRQWQHSNSFHFTVSWCFQTKKTNQPLMVSLAYNSADLHSQWHFPSIQMQAMEQQKTAMPHLRITQWKSWDIVLPLQTWLLQTAVWVDSHSHQKGNPHLSDSQEDALYTWCMYTDHCKLSASQALC